MVGDADLYQSGDIHVVSAAISASIAVHVCYVVHREIRSSDQCVDTVADAYSESTVSTGNSSMSNTTADTPSTSSMSMLSEIMKL